MMMTLIILMTLIEDIYWKELCHNSYLVMEEMEEMEEIEGRGHQSKALYNSSDLVYHILRSNVPPKTGH